MDREFRKISTNLFLGKCRCLQDTSSNDLVAKPGCDDDRASVAALPDQWVPKHSGPILANYLKQRKQNHELVLKDLADIAVTVNDGVNTKIREIAEQLLAHVKQNQTNIKAVVDDCNTGVDPLTTAARNEALKNVNQHNSDLLIEISAFKRDAFALERERACGIRKLLRDQFQRLIAVGHHPPKDLLHDFDDRIYEINQQLLSNSRAYHDLEAQLQAQADEDVIRARSGLNQLCLGNITTYRGRSAYPSLPSKKLLTQRPATAIDGKLTSVISSLDPGKTVDECVSRLVDAYRQAIIKVFTGFSGKLCTLHKNLTSFNFTNEDKCEVSDLQSVVERTLCHLSNTGKKSLSQEWFEITHNDAMSMQKSLYTLGERLRDTYTILHDGGHLWDAHMMRTALAQKLTMAAVEDLLTSNDIIEQAHEVSFNIAIEQLRCTPDVDKLQQNNDVLKVMLDRISEMYNQHSASEIERLEEFMNLPLPMSNTLLAEFGVFLENHPRLNMRSSSSNMNECVIDSPPIAGRRPTPLHRVILQTDHQELALKNWRNGFLEAFESNMSLVPVELTHQARQWVDERAAALHMRYTLKMVSHSIRAERVNAARDARLAELKQHEDRLKSHLEAVFNLIDQLPEEASDFLSLEAPELYPVCEWVNSLNADLQVVLANVSIDPEVKRLKMISYAPRLSKHRRLFENSLEEAIHVYKKRIEQRIQEARISNVRFMSQIRLFGEGGRYSASEATKTSAALLRAADALEQCAHRSLDVLNHRRAQLLALADQTLLPLQKVVEEFVKISTKTKVDKKKAVLPGKKKK